MEDIGYNLAMVTSLKRALRWTLDKKEIDAIQSKIEQLKSLVVPALQESLVSIRISAPHTQRNCYSKLSLTMEEEITVGFFEMKTNRNSKILCQTIHHHTTPTLEHYS